MQETVLITGGSGLVGARLTEFLLEKGYAVRHLSRKRDLLASVPCYQWNVEKGEWDKEAVKGVSYIVHLAGAGVADRRWTTKRKAEVLNSRVQSSRMVTEMVKASQGSVKGVASSSAVGYYGVETGVGIVHEEQTPGEDFLARVCIQWEEEINKCKNLTKVAVLRTGIVLSNKGGALPKMALPIKLGVGSPIGDGKQPMPWIHIDDLCRMYIYTIENGLEGAFNAVAPEPVNNKVFTKELAAVLNRKLRLPNVPAFALTLLFGEMSKILLTGVNATSDKIASAGFKWQFSKLDEALKDLYSS